MNIIQRRKLKRSADLKVLFFTFVGAFLLFFTAFTYFLPTVTPKVEIPALSEDQVFNSITSHDFRGKLDPRLHNLELQEKGIYPDSADGQEEEAASADSETSEEQAVNSQDSTNETGIREARDLTEDQEMKAEAIAEPGNLKRSIPGVPPRPKMLASVENADTASVPAVFQAKVVVGSYATMREAKLISDALLSYNFDPVLKEIGGSYTLQIGSFSDINRARSLVQELKSHNFDARIIYE
ncbi:MAG: hypothetical protein GX568_04400 [Candidatus Gastranaerophilales bacterium]|nr:hypothetical protein [Candidatus Gastranaerophilales bacterium]